MLREFNWIWWIFDEDLQNNDNVHGTLYLSDSCVVLLPWLYHRYIYILGSCCCNIWSTGIFNTALRKEKPKILLRYHSYICLFIIIPADADAIMCANLVPPENGARSSEEPMLSVGATLSFTCREGYRISGAHTVTCQTDGTFDDVAPTCGKKYYCVCMLIVINQRGICCKTVF